jgi:phosphoribosylformimino-5-aminoimidazole carboxamide ribotide isomerase
MLVLPAIDLKDGRCVRLSQGRASELTVYDANPIEVAQRFEAAGAQMLHVVDLDGAFTGESRNREMAKRIVATVNVPVQIGGGIRSHEDVRELIDAGAARVVIGSLAAKFPEKLAVLLDEFGAQIAVGIDAKAGELMVHGWREAAGFSPIDFARQVVELGVERIVYTDISRDGMLSGVNVEATVAMVQAAQVRVTASGGVSSIDDIRKLMNANEPLVDSLIIGKALYENRFTLEEAIRTAEHI